MPTSTPNNPLDAADGHIGDHIPGRGERGHSGRTVFIFSSLAHFYIHLCIAFYFVIVLSLERSWDLPYHELVSLWTLGSLMVGVCALPAGMIADRFGAPRMMMLFFLGLGGCAIGAGLSTGESSLFWWLTGIGVFAAIYHPVGIPWLVRNIPGKRGKALALNGIFGSFGGAAAGLATGFLIDVINWRAAFIVPGVIVVLTGVAMITVSRLGGTLEREVSSHSHSTAEHPALGIFALLMFSMFISGLLFNGTQTALPKYFELRGQSLIGDSVFGIGVLVACVYTLAGFMQILGGHLADRYPLKTVYMSAIALQIPFLWLAAQFDGWMLMVTCTLMVVANTGALPAENMILARFAPSNRHGLAFGAKFVLSFGAAPVAVLLVSYIQDRTGDLSLLFRLYSGIAIVAVAVVMLLPSLPRMSALASRST